MRTPFKALDAEKDAEAFFKTIRGDTTDADVKRLAELLLKHRISGLREAASDCEGQRLQWEDVALVEYRRGQYRGANDCVVVVTRKADYLEGKWPPRSF